MKPKFRSTNWRTDEPSWPFSDMYAEWLAEAERRRLEKKLSKRRLRYGQKSLEEVLTTNN